LGYTATDAGLILVPSSIMTAIMMPFIGKLLQKGVPQKYLVTMGFGTFFLYSLWMYYVMTPDTGTEHFFWPLVVRGVGLGLLFVPITTLSLSTLVGKDIGDGAAFTGMTRQLGGSFGIAIITTFLARFNQQHRVDLIPNIDTTNVNVQNRLQGLKQLFMSKGFSANEAMDKAYKALDLAVTKQAAVLSFMDVFLYLGILFLICIPFVMFIKKGAGKVNMGAAH
ncbi:MAG: MFS transporter, partial [Aquaticitalea sp.]